MGKRILSVLLIEDSPEYAGLVECWLSGSRADVGFELDWQSTLAAGIARFARVRVDVTLLDLGLPDSHGFESYAQVRARAPRTPVVILGSSDLDSVALRTLREEAQGYLVKSACHAEALVRAVCIANESTSAVGPPLPEAPPQIVIHITNELPRELVSEYLDDCRNNLIELRAATVKRDYKQARVYGHRMKGSGSPYGFPMLTQFGAAIEQAASCGEASALEKEVDQFAEYLGRLEIA